MKKVRSPKSEVRSRMSAIIIVFALSLFVCQNLNAAPVADSVTAPHTIIMPTAKPIHGGYVRLWELAFLKAGFGFGNFSFTGESLYYRLWHSGRRSDTFRQKLLLPMKEEFPSLSVQIFCGLQVIFFISMLLLQLHWKCKMKPDTRDSFLLKA